MSAPATWRRVGGDACLDFANTVGGRVSRSSAGRTRDLADRITREDLGDYDALVRWAVEADLLEPADAARLGARARAAATPAGRTYTRAFALRESIYRIAKCLVEGWPVPARDLEVLDRELREARAHQRLVPGQGGLTTAWIGDTSAPDRMLWPIALSAAELFGSARVGQLKQCPGEDCGWLFLDTTRNHSRQWCEMADCGNLAKVRRFRRRARRKRGAAS